MTVHALAYRFILLLGAAIFGVGWSLDGCPGPSIVSSAAGATPVVLFVAAMLAGMLLTSMLETVRRSRRRRQQRLVERGRHSSACPLAVLARDR